MTARLTEACFCYLVSKIPKYCEAHNKYRNVGQTEMTYSVLNSFIAIKTSTVVAPLVMWIYMVCYEITLPPPSPENVFLILPITGSQHSV